MSDFAPLLQELDAWTERRADFWWRDDDAVAPTPALQPLLDLTRHSSVPVVLAVVPFGATAALAERTARLPLVRIWQHGIRHYNTARPPAKKQELTLASPQSLCDLVTGRARLRSLFGPQFQPALVPPWNRIDASFLPHLAKSGFRGLSTFKPRQQLSAAPGVSQINTHVDLMFWRPNPIFRGPSACVADICTHLAAKRSGHADNTEPTGVLSHHNVMNIEAWDFLADLFAATKNHPSCHWVIPAL